MVNISILNILLFSLFFLIVIKTNKHNLALQFISGIYLLSAVSGLLFLLFGDREYYNLTILGSILFFIFFLISVIPLFKIRIKKEYNIYLNEKFIKLLSVIMLVGSILPFTAMVLSLKPLLSGDIISFMKEAHDARFYEYAGEKNANIFDTLISISMKVAYYMRAFLPLFVVYLYNKYKKINKYIGGILLTQITLIISSLLTSSRFLLVDFTLTYIFTYFFLYHKLETHTKLFFRKLFCYGGLIILFALSIITIGRAYAMGYTDFTSIIGWISLYLGEGMLNFNEFTIHDDIRFGIEGIFPTLLNKHDYQLFLQYNADEYHKEWSWLLGHATNTFETCYGDFVGAFDIFNSILFIMLISTILICLKRKIVNTFSGIAFFITIYKYVYFGFMYFPYGSIKGNNYLYQALLSIIIIRIFEIYGKKTAI